MKSSAAKAIAAEAAPTTLGLVGAALAAIWIAAALILAAPAAARATALPALPSDSVYQLNLSMTDQDGATRPLVSARGQVRIVSMFYANCPYICPLIVETIKRTEKALTPAQASKLGVMLFTMDPERDTPAALKQVEGERKLDATRWRLERTGADDVRKLAAVLGIQYRQLENRDFNHSAALILIDADGRVLARSSKIGEPDPEFVAAVRRAL
jgi:protein SCO1/2